jgi:hypothetical protein
MTGNEAFPFIVLKGLPGSEEVPSLQARLTILNEDWKKYVEKSSM